MTEGPQISVVMGVYNGADALRATVESVLTQEGVDLEFIVVDDGSTDASLSILEGLAVTDSRLRVVHQDNAGLTRALMRGCGLARGKYIARQDCGDLSPQGRLRDELRAIETHGEAALVSCGTRFVGPQGEPLYEVVISEQDASAGLLTLDPQRLRGPAHHGSVLFRRDLYERVGGYREQFYFAQDLDLWIRLAEHGRHVVLPDLLYQAKFAPGSISGLQRGRQVECAGIALECARLRRAASSEAQALARASLVQPRAGKAGALDRASALYFVGVCLRKRGDARSKKYFREALRVCPLHLKSALRLLTG